MNTTNVESSGVSLHGRDFKGTKSFDREIEIKQQKSQKKNNEKHLPQQIVGFLGKIGEP